MENLTEPLIISVQTCSGLSLLTVLFTVLVYLKYKEVLPVFYLFVLVTQFSCAIKLIVMFIPHSGDSCMVQGFLGNFGTLSAVSWSAILAQKFYALHVNEENISEKMPFYLFIAYGIPAILAALPFFTESYGNIGGFCWIKGEYSLIWRLFSFYLFVAFCIVFTFWRYHLLIRFLQEDTEYLPTSSILMNNKNSSFRRMRMYSVILILSFGPSIVYWMVDVGGAGNEYFELVCMSFECLFAFFNAVVYLFKQNILAMVWNSLVCKKEEKERNMSRFWTMNDPEYESSMMQDFSVI